MKFQPNIKNEGSVKLDLKDKKILQALSTNARIPISQLAKRVGLSRDAIAHRIAQYEHQGLIQGYKTLINIKNFGYNNYHLFLQLNKPSQATEQEVLKKLQASPHIRAILSYNGKYDLELAITATTPEHFETILEEILHQCGSYLLDYEILIITKSYRAGAFPNSFLKQEGIPTKKIATPFTLDKKDHHILQTLANNARISFSALASQTDLSADAIRYRLNKLEDSQTIIGYRPAFNYDLLGYHVYAILAHLQSFNQHQEQKLKQLLLQDPHVLWAVKTLGSYNLLMYIAAHNPHAVHETIHNLRQTFPAMIQRYEFLLAEEEHKYTYYPETLLE
ncbi:MAG: Lrp/AsnC family transcriptional regulator [Nanoarchaeota archaeon]|nr:Lrp/AsnC family transcriptional regulator [Nanoarchaeota archaeon]